MMDNVMSAKHGTINPDGGRPHAMGKRQPTRQFALPHYWRDPYYLPAYLAVFVLDSCCNFTFYADGHI